MRQRKLPEVRALARQYRPVPPDSFELVINRSIERKHEDLDVRVDLGAAHLRSRSTSNPAMTAAAQAGDGRGYVINRWYDCIDKTSFEFEREQRAKCERRIRPERLRAEGRAGRLIEEGAARRRQAAFVLHPVAVNTASESELG